MNWLVFGVPVWKAIIIFMVGLIFGGMVGYSFGERRLLWFEERVVAMLARVLDSDEEEEKEKPND